MRLSTLVLISLAFAPMTLAAAEPAVKKSEQGIHAFGISRRAGDYWRAARHRSRPFHL